MLGGLLRGVLIAFVVFVMIWPLGERGVGWDDAIGSWLLVQRGKRLGHALTEIDRRYWPYGRLEVLLEAKDAYRSWVLEFPSELRGHAVVGHLYFEGTLKLARVCHDLSEKVTDPSGSKQHWRGAAHWYLVTFNNSPDPEHRAEAACRLQDLDLGPI